MRHQKYIDDISNKMWREVEEWLNITLNYCKQNALHELTAKGYTLLERFKHNERSIELYENIILFAQKIPIPQKNKKI